RRTRNDRIARVQELKLQRSIWERERRAVDECYSGIRVRRGWRGDVPLRTSAPDLHRLNAFRRTVPAHEIGEQHPAARHYQILFPAGIKDVPSVHVKQLVAVDPVKTDVGHKLSSFLNAAHEQAKR